MSPTKERQVLIKDDPGMFGNVTLSKFFCNGQTVRAKDFIFEVVSVNDKRNTVSLKLIGGIAHLL